MRPRLTYAQKSVLLQLVRHGDMQPADGNHRRRPSRAAKGLVMKRLSIVFTCDSEPIGLYEIERRLRTAGFKRPQAGSIMDAEQSDELAEAYEQGKQAVFDAMNHFDELAIVERANPYRKDGR